MKTLLAATLRTFTDPGLAPSRMPPTVQTLASHAQSLALLGARLYVARIFFMSGLTKLHDWSSTLALFNDIYQVPVLPPMLAAYLGTFGELVFPVLLVLGLATRFAGAGLFFVNLVAALSLSADDFSPAAAAQHALWGVLALVIVLWGSGRWAVDHWAAGRVAADRPR